MFTASRQIKKCRIPLLLAAWMGVDAGIAAVAQFDVNDFATASPTLSGWTPVTGAADNAETLTGSDGVHTLTLSTSGDGQDRDRNAGSFPADSSFWRDFWFVADSTVGGQTATATITGLTANAFYSVEVWAFDLNSTGNRAASWTDSVSGNTGTLAFNGSTTTVPASLGDSVINLQARANGSGVITLTGAGAAGGSAGLPNVFVSGIRVSAGASSLPVVEAESGTLGSAFALSTLDGAASITISPTSASTTVPGSAARVASYSVQFPSADVYQLYARVRVGAGGFDDDSFFHGNGFGAKSPTTASNWVFSNGLAVGGFTGFTDVVTVGGGSAGTQVWKWMKFSTLFTVPTGGLTQTFQIAGREDGFFIDRFVFGSSSTDLTVAELESGAVSQPPDFVTFDGPDGIAIHRFGVPSLGITPDGANPASGLVLIAGELQGTTLNGGLSGDGAAFRVSLDGNTFETLESFTNGLDAAHPEGGLQVSGSGFFGVSQAGGTFGAGTLFERRADGTVGVIRSFNNLAAHTGTNIGGASPSGLLAISSATLYGATAAGGTNGTGTVFWVASSGANFTVLKEFSLLDSNFGTNADGAYPRSGMVLSGGKLYGTATAGGTGGSGVVFSMNTNGSDYAVLHHFAPLDSVTATNVDGATPCGGLVVSNGIIYGTTLAGGTGGKGTVFAINTNGDSFLTLYHFTSTDPLSGTNMDGASPATGLHLSGNVLYGVTSAGGGGATGTVFALDPFLPDFRTFHSFEALTTDGTNQFGAHPVAPLVRVGHALFGTAFSGGPGGSGTVFRVPIPLTADISAVGNPNGTVNANFIGRGAPNSNYKIQAADELSSSDSWQEVITQPADASGFLFYPEVNQTSPRRFYRVAEVP